MQVLDSLGVGKALGLFPQQIKEAWKQAYSTKLPAFSPKAVVISGMGGSSNAAKILEGLYEEDDSVPFDIDIHNDYALPVWVGPDSLVIANSYSGNTEETLSGVALAKQKGAKVVGVTTGGKLAKMIRSGEIEGVIVDGSNTNPTGFPKTGLGVSFGALAGTLAKLGIIKTTESELFAAVEDLGKIKEQWDTPSVAKWMQGSLPVLFAARPFLGSLNAGRNALCEISRNFTQFYDFPEVNHVLIEATQAPEVAKKSIKYYFFISKFNHPRVLERFRITARIFKEQGLNFDNYTLKGDSKLVQALEIPYFCARIAYDFALLDKNDPGPEPWITKLKESLAERPE